MTIKVENPDLPATVELCARELRQVGDKLYWRYKLLEILLKNYETVTKIKWDVKLTPTEKELRIKEALSQHTHTRKKKTLDVNPLPAMTWWYSGGMSGVDTTHRSSQFGLWSGIMTRDRNPWEVGDPTAIWTKEERLQSRYLTKIMELKHTHGHVLNHIYCMFILEL